MCLSTVYQVCAEDQTPLCQHVSSAVVDGSQVRFTDIMGDETVVDGIIEKIDLVNNVILVRTKN